MELATILIGVAVFIISALMIYCISAFSMKEKTFEEVMEEQKRRMEEEREKSKAGKKAEKEQQKKKFKKGKSDKAKVNSTEIEPEVEHKMVNLEIEPEIIQPIENVGLNAGVRQRGKKEKATKSILHNKDEIVPVVAKTVEMSHTVIAKDEVALKKNNEKEKVVVEKIQKSKAVPQQQEMKKEARPKLSMEVKENLPPRKSEEPQRPSKGAPVKQKADSKVKPTSDDTTLNGVKLISSVKSAKLSDEEIQVLIEILLNRQGIHSSPVDSWNKKSQKGDPLPLLKKQLEEKERALQEEQKMGMSANSKVKELRNELGSEKTKYSAMEKRFQEQMNHKQAELNALQQRMQHTHEEHMKEASSLQARLKQVDQSAANLGAGDQAKLQKLTSENKILQDTLGLKAKEIAVLSGKVKNIDRDSQNSINKIQAAEAARKSAEAMCASLEEKLKKAESSQKDSDSVIDKRVEEIAVQLKKSESKNDSLSSDLQNATSGLKAAEAEVSTLKGKLQELEQNLKQADASREASSKSQRLQQENKSLSDENKTVSEKLNSAPAENGVDHGPSAEEHEKIVSDLQIEVASHKATVTDLQQQLEQQKSKNNDLSSSAVTECETYDKAVFQRLFPEVQVSEKLPHKDWVVAFEKQAANSLKQVDSQLENDNKKLKQEVQQYSSIVSETENKLKQLEKSIDAEEKKWEEKLKEAQSSAKDPSAERRIGELETLVSEQEKQMQEYRNVLSLTENSLKDLESRVSTEESQWQGKLSTTQSELDQSQTELSDLRKQLQDSPGSQEMQTKVVTLEASLKESQEKIVVLTKEKESLEKKVQSSAGAASEGSSKEVSDLRTQIETERKKNKDLCLNVVKLNGIIKTGQDALSQEQELVKKLQEQLDSKSIKSGVSEIEENEQLRSKLSEKQKLLEREMTVNKQLSERLAQLGVLAATSNENGTSV